MHILITKMTLPNLCQVHNDEQNGLLVSVSVNQYRWCRSVSAGVSQCQLVLFALLGSLFDLDAVAGRSHCWWL